MNNNQQQFNAYKDKLRGCLFGGAVGDALGYPVEFLDENEIIYRYGKSGITEYKLDKYSGKALISDDTQMTLFTANAILFGETRLKMRGIGGRPLTYLPNAYQDWLMTQTVTFEKSRDLLNKGDYKPISWLFDVEELFSLRAPGITCLSALKQIKDKKSSSSYISENINDSKGCGGVMRVAPLGLTNRICSDIETYDLEAAEASAITHGHSLGYMTSSVLVHIINRIVFYTSEMTLKEIVVEAKETVLKLFSGDKHIDELENIINKAIELSENSEDDLSNIHELGEGWVAEEALAISIYCALKYKDDFSKGIIAAVNHKGDSDSTGAITGNILGALHGYNSIEDKWKNDLELSEVVLELADDLAEGCKMSEYSSYKDKAWEDKYIFAKRVIGE